MSGIEISAVAGAKPRLDKLALFRSLGYVPHPAQLEVHNSTAPRRILACGVRFGKSLAAAMEGVAAALQPCARSTGWICAPTYDLTEKVYREIVIIVGQKLKHRLIAMKEHDKKLMIRNMAGGESEIRCKSADNPISLLGEGLDWLVVDEAARLRSKVWQSYLSQRLIDKKGWALIISTPHGKGWFYDLYKRGTGPDRDPEYQSWNFPSRVNPHLDALQIERERERLPHAVYMQEYEAQFMEGAGSVFRNVRDCATGAFCEPVPGESYVAGLDLAKTEDFTVLIIMNSKREVVHADRFHRLEWAMQVARVKAACDRYHHAKILVDSTGAGEPVFDLLRRSECNVRPYPFTAKSKEDIIQNLALLTEQKEIVLPRAELWEVGLDELESYEYSVTDAGNTRMGAPSGAHDDCVIATALAAWQGRKRRAPIVMWA